MFKYIKDKREICRICYQTIPESMSSFKVKQKLVFPDIDGAWTAMKSVWVCDKCIRAIREAVKEEA
jgi:hypothetical protein